MSPSLRRLSGFWLRHLFPLRRDLDLLTDMIYWPLIDILLWGLTSRWLGEAAEVQQLVASILLALIFWNIIWRAQSEVARNLIDEIWNNNLVNLFSTPFSLSEWIAGVLSLSVFKTFFTISVMIPVVFFLYQVNFFTIGLWLVPFFALLTMTGWSVGFIASAIVMIWGPKVQTVVWSLPAILLPFSAVFFPVAQLPALIRPISWAVPSTYVFEALRSQVITGSLPLEWLAISLVLNLVWLTVTVWVFVKAFRYSLSLGLGRFQ